MPTTSAPSASHEAADGGGYRPTAAIDADLVAAGHDLDAIAAVVRRALGDRADLAVYLAVAEFGGEHLRMAAWALPAGTVDEPPPGHLITLRSGPLGRAFAEGTALELQPDPEQLLRTLRGRYRRLVAGHPLRHLHVVPVATAGGRPVGMLGLSTVHEPPTTADRAALVGLAARIAVPVAHARLLPTVARAARRQEALAGLARDAFTTTSTRALYDLVARTMAEALDASTAGVFEIERGGAVLRAAIGIDTGRIDRLRLPDDEAFLTAALAAERALLTVDRTPGGETISAAHRVFGISSSLCTTVRCRGEAVAVIGVGRNDPLLFGPDDLAFVDSVASITANALEMHATHARLRHQADTDDLTGLPNRSLMAALIDDAAAAAGRDGQPLALLLADLDGFKVLNDSLGHAAGDEVLRVVADRFALALGADGLLGRLGGDEFAALLPATGADAAMAMADRLLGALTEPVRVNGTEITVRASFGVTVFAPVPAGGDQPAPPAAGAAHLLPQADLAMYRAKSSSRQRVAMYDHGMQDEVQQRLAIEEGLRAAIGTDQLTLAYQPIVDPYEGGRIKSLEALLRWNHPTLGQVPPDRFVAIAEESDLIHQLSNHVLEMAARQTAAWDAAGLLDRRHVSVNLSAHDLMDPAIAERVQQALTAAACDGSKFGVEVTETVLGDGTVLAGIDALRRLGLHVSLDDYGTGYSSVGQIRTMPFHVLKIDRSYIQSMHRPADRVIVDLTIMMAHVLGMRVVAEGVETTQQLEYLLSQGCDLVQGYLFSRPVSAEVVTGYLADGLPELPDLDAMLAALQQPS